jgi:hypothetical protein
MKSNLELERQKRLEKLSNPYNFKSITDEEAAHLVAQILWASQSIGAVALIALIGSIAYEENLVHKCDLIRHAANEAYTATMDFDESAESFIRKTAKNWRNAK